jgi:hypothetical protein
MNDEPALEREATTVGRKVMRGHPLHGRGPHVVPRSSHNSGPIQRIGREEEEPLGPPPPLPPIPSKFVQPPPLPKKPPAIKVAKVLFPFSDVKSQAPVHTPEEKLAFLVEYATRYLIDALYRISTIQEFDDDSVHMNRTRLKTHAMILTEILQSAQRKYKEPEVQQRIAALLHPLPRLIQLADPPLAVLAEQWPGIRAELTSTLEFFMTKLGVY